MTSPFAQDSEYRMNFYKHMQSRRRRRLPRVERTSSQQTHDFWPTFRGALAWMRKNQETMNTAMNLLDIYPSLIQDSSMDRFWDFIKPFLNTGHSTAHSTGKSRKPEPLPPYIGKTKPSSTKDETSVKSKPQIPQIPSIFVSADMYDDSDDIIRDSDLNQRKTKLYVSGQSQSDFPVSPYSQLMSDFNTEYNVLQPVPSVQSSSKVCETLSDSDIFVFLMSQESVSSPTSYRDLSAAWTMDLPVIFIKPPGFKLPSPLPDSVVLYTLEKHNTSHHRRSAHGKKLAASVTPSFGGKLGVHTRNGGVLPKLRPMSAHELSTTEGKHPLVHRDSCDLILMVINGYREACVWDPINHKHSFEDIKSKFEKVLAKMYTPSPTPSIDIPTSGMFISGSSNKSCDSKVEGAHFLQIPNPDLYSPLNSSLDDLHIDDDDDHASLHIPSFRASPILNSLSDPEDLTSPVEKETFYVVFKDRHSPGNVIKWPPNDPDIHHDDVFADSPLSFKDVDLTLDNKADLDTSDCDSAAGMY